MGKLVWTCMDGAAPKVLWVHNGGTEEKGRGWDHWGSSLKQHWIDRGRKAIRNLQKPRKMLFALWLGDFKPGWGCWVINSFGILNVRSEGLACGCPGFEPCKNYTVLLARKGSLPFYMSKVWALQKWHCSVGEEGPFAMHRTCHTLSAQQRWLSTQLLVVQRMWSPKFTVKVRKKTRARSFKILPLRKGWRG